MSKLNQQINENSSQNLQKRAKGTCIDNAVNERLSNSWEIRSYNDWKVIWEPDLTQQLITGLY